MKPTKLPQTWSSATNPDSQLNPSSFQQPITKT